MWVVGRHVGKSELLTAARLVNAGRQGGPHPVSSTAIYTGSNWAAVTRLQKGVGQIE